MPTYTPAPEVQEIAEDLILLKSRFDELHVLNPRIEYVFVDKAPVKDGNTVYACVKKIGGLAAYLADQTTEKQKLLAISEYEMELAKRQEMTKKQLENAVRIIEPYWGDPLYVLQVSKDVWEFMNDDTKEALIFHELCHIVVEADEDEDTGREFLKLSLRGHDFEDMLCVVEEYGAWTPALKQAREAANVYAERQNAIDDEPHLPFDENPPDLRMVGE